MPKCGASARRAKRSRRFRSNRPRHSSPSPATLAGRPPRERRPFCSQTTAQRARWPVACPQRGTCRRWRFEGHRQGASQRRRPLSGAPAQEHRGVPGPPAQALPPPVASPRPCARQVGAGPLPLEPPWRRPISGTSGGSAVRGHPMRTANIKVASIIGAGAILFGACAAQAQSSSTAASRPASSPHARSSSSGRGHRLPPGSVRSTRRGPTRTSRRRCKARRRSRRWRHASATDGLA